MPNSALTKKSFVERLSPEIRQALLAAAVMLAAVIQILDTTIANVALPHMQGTLSATQDQISWVLTSYIITAAIVMPMTGLSGSGLTRESIP